MRVYAVPVALGSYVVVMDDAFPVRVVPRLYAHARQCALTSPCSSSPRRRGSILAAKCRMMMDSRLRGNDGWICGNDCLFSACIVWVMSGVFGWCQSCLRSAPIV